MHLRALLLALLVIAAPSVASTELQLDLQSRLDTLAMSSEPAAAGDVALLHAFYAERAYRPLWVETQGLNPRGALLAGRLAEADGHGLNPRDYQASEIVALSGVADAAARTELEVLLSLGLLRYGRHLKEGRVTPSRVDRELFREPEQVDRRWLLESAASAADLGAFLDALAPAEPQYRRTVDVLARYRAIAAGGGWRALPEGESLKVGMRDPRVPILRERLREAGDLRVDAGSDEMLYDEALEAAVKRFQYRHGLAQDGVVGPRTRAAFNVPVEQRIETIVLNLERRRWLPDHLGERYVFVNMAGFELKVVDGDDTVFDTRVVVGTPYHRTPVFSGTMSYVVFNPYWHIPPSIARNEILPAVKKDIAYLAKKNIRVFSGWGADAVELDPYAIDWSEVSPRGLRYKFRQDAGPENALGRVKFMFPNRHNIYLHDTPARHLFARAARGFSHGCIRVEKPLELAALLLGDAGDWSRETIDAIIAKGERRIVNLRRPVPVHLTYLTNWVNKDGSIFFREDIYRRDRRLAAALEGVLY